MSDLISKELFDQIKWERDIAIGQLKELGYGLGEKIRTDKDAISRQAVIQAVDKHTFDTDEGLCLDDDISCILEEIPSAQSDLQPTCNQLATDTISRQTAIDALGEEPLIWRNTLEEITARAQWRQDRDAILSVPSAQQEIIRCGECKHSFLHDNGEKISRICGLTRMCGTTPDDWFCADAERSEE